MKNVNDVDFDTNINHDMCMKVMSLSTSYVLLSISFMYMMMYMYLYMNIYMDVQMYV